MDLTVGVAIAHARAEPPRSVDFQLHGVCRALLCQEARVAVHDHVSPRARAMLRTSSRSRRACSRVELIHRRDQRGAKSAEIRIVPCPDGSQLGEAETVNDAGP